MLTSKYPLTSASTNGEKFFGLLQWPNFFSLKRTESNRNFGAGLLTQPIDLQVLNIAALIITAILGHELFVASVMNCDCT
jgi:hypothetical protein